MIAEPVKSDPDDAAPRRRGRPGHLPPEESGRITRRITAIAVAIGVVFAFGKFHIWQETHSVGILASLVHSALDVFGAVSSFIAVRYAARPPDNTYRFGRGKAECFSAVFQVCLIVFAASHLFEEAAHTLVHPHRIEQSGRAIAAMLVFIVITAWLLLAQTWAIRATGSIAVRGDRAHYTADMAANVIILFGIVLSSGTSFIRADAFVGLLMAAWLLWTAFRVAQLAWAQLLDRELPDDDRNLIIKLALQEDRVIAVHDLRTRASGPHIHIQMRLDLDNHLSLSEAHDIVLKVEKRLMMEYGAADVLIHPHPTGCEETHGNERFRANL